MNVSLDRVPDKSRAATYTIAPLGTRADYNTSATNARTVIQTLFNSASPGDRFVFRKGTYTILSTSFPLRIPSYVTIEGESREKTIFVAEAGLNDTVFKNLDLTNGNTGIVIQNLTIDQQGADQTSGGGMSFAGITDCLIRDVTVERSHSFNMFVSSLAGTALTGTLTFTNGDSTVTGSSTLFTSELAVGSIIKSAASHFQRVLSITSDTSLELDRQWGWATETGVTARNVPANSGNKLINCSFKGNDTDDNVGLGLFDDGLIQGCTSNNASGYGYGPDHTNRLRFVSSIGENNANSGIGFETSGECEVIGGAYRGNNKGIYLLSGAYRNRIIGANCSGNNTGIGITYNSTAFPTPDNNEIIGAMCGFNVTQGIRVGGAKRTSISGGQFYNNGDNGIFVVTENSRVPDATAIGGAVQCYDNQDTKTQDRGIYVLNGTDTLIDGVISRTADHNTAGITDSGTGTILGANIT